MGSDDEWGDECSVIGDKGEIGFIDYADNRSTCSYNPAQEGPIKISVPFPFVNGNPQSVVVGATTSDSITIRNTTSEPVDLWSVKIYASTPENSFTLSLMEPPRSNSDVEAVRAFLESYSLEDRVLQPNETLTVWLSCKPKDICLHTSAVHFELESGTIERVVHLLADDMISKALASRAPYSKNMRKKKQFSIENFVTGQRPSRGTPQKVRNRLPRYDIPKEIRELLESKQIPDVVEEGLSCVKNYVPFFKNLIIMEELQLEDDMRSYDMENVSFRRRGSQYLSLEVLGLAERRPSLVHGDSIFVKLASECRVETSPPFQGFIHRVEADEVYLRFAPEYHSRHRDGNLYNVRFTYNRVNMRRFYQAIDASTQLEEDVLFPAESCERRLIMRKPLVPLTRVLNEEQTLAIEMVLGCKGVPPYVIHGPPGTGKTVTLVESILQLYKTRKRARILVCAPSNSAADHVLEKILKEKVVRDQRNEIFRLNASARPYEEMSPNLAPICFVEDGVFKCPPIDTLLRFKIIVSTYMSASLLHAEGIRRGHFTHIFLDEAGQASEPETMISIANFCDKSTVVVLAGDPLQLGPVIYSKEAESYGLGKSYLERIFESECYSDMDENYITKLVRNYRCHPEILHLPSEVFYKGELVACKEDSSPFMDNVDFLPSKEFPLLFFGIQGCDEREGNNPSWFNRFEASKVAEIVRKLTEKGDLQDEDIGVITPYRQQVLKIKTALEHFDMTGVKVGSVEQFQGQEKQVIIVSTVRSTVKHNQFDRNHCLGFLSNPRRFNVAITRAISLLIIIGNPHIICMDGYWNMLLWRCIDNNSYLGCSPPQRQEFIDNETLREYVSNGDGEDYGSSRVDGWVQDSAQTEFAKSATGWDGDEISDPTGWGENSLATQVPEPTGWGEEPSQTELLNPVKDESEWSDGWK